MSFFELEKYNAAKSLQTVGKTDVQNVWERARKLLLMRKINSIDI